MNNLKRIGSYVLAMAIGAGALAILRPDFLKIAKHPNQDFLKSKSYHVSIYPDSFTGPGKKRVRYVEGNSELTLKCTFDVPSSKVGVDYDENSEINFFQRLEKSHISGIILEGHDGEYLINAENSEPNFNDALERFGQRCVGLRELVNDELRNRGINITSSDSISLYARR